MCKYSVSVLSDHSVLEVGDKNEYSITSVEAHISNRDAFVGCLVKGELVNLGDILEYSDTYQSDIYEALLASTTAMQIFQILDSRSEKVFGFPSQLPISLGLKNLGRIFVIRSVEFRCEQLFKTEYFHAFLTNIRDIFQLDECLFVHPTLLCDFSHASPDATCKPNKQSDQTVFLASKFVEIGHYKMMVMKMFKPQKFKKKNLKVSHGRGKSVV